MSSQHSSIGDYVWLVSILSRTMKLVFDHVDMTSLSIELDRDAAGKFVTIEASRMHVVDVILNLRYIARLSICVDLTLNLVSFPCLFFFFFFPFEREGLR